MWRTNTIWLDLAVFLFLLLVGHILLGHFEDYKPWWRRLLKVLLSVVLFLVLIATLGRLWAWLLFIAPVGIGLAVVHGWWLPKHGINGWTGQPREKYLALVRRRRRRPAA
jgi:hypothetical protein